MKKTYIALLLLLLIITSPLFAIGFGYHVLEIRTIPDFGKGVFPSSLKYQFNFPVPDFVGGNTTELAFRLDNGLVYRTLNQDPATGREFSKYPELLAASGFTKDDSREYSVQFDEFSLHFSQGLLKTPMSDKDLLRVEAAFGGRFENAFENLFFMYDENHTSGVFNSSYGVERFPDNVWNGAPELERRSDGLRSLFSTFLNFQFDINMLRDDWTKKQGVKLAFDYRYSPKSLPMNDGTADFSKLTIDLSAAYTIGAAPMSSKPELSWISSVIGADVRYRFLMGDSIPQYAIQDSIFGVIPPKTEHLILGRGYLTVFGPQITTKDLYPYVSVFGDVALSFGKELNSIDDEWITEYVGSVGLKAEFNIYNFASLWYEIGYVVRDSFSLVRHPVKGRFGISFGV